MTHSTLAARLGAQRHPVSIARGIPVGAAGAALLDELIADGVVPVRVHGPEGITELDLDVTAHETRTEPGARIIRLRGSLVLDDEPVDLLVEIETDTLRGWGELQPPPR